MTDGPLSKPGIPRPPEGWWERVPVLNELYKLLSSRDPVNWELARQVAVALAAHDEPAIDVERAQPEFEALSRGAEVKAEQFCGLEEGELALVEVCTRERWVERNLSSLRFLMDPLAEKFSAAMAPVPLPGEARQVLGQIGGILMGLQAGFVLGYLARHVMGQYEVVLPEPEGGRLLYIVGNLHAVERDWELDPKEFRYWVALHEVTHQLQFSTPWVRMYFHGQLRTLIDSLDFDPERMQQALGGMGMLDPERMAEMLQDPDALVQATWTPLARDAISRLQAFLTLVEGYSTFVMDGVAAEVLRDHAKMKEVISRRKNTASPGEVLFERLLGVELKRQQYEQGATFCRYVATMRDVSSLNRAWDNPESLPTADELADPEAWITRVLD